MGLTREFKDVVQARYQGDAKFRRVMLAGAIQSLLSGEGAVWRVAYLGRAGGRGIGKPPRHSRQDLRPLSNSYIDVRVGRGGHLSDTPIQSRCELLSPTKMKLAIIVHIR